MDDWTYQQANHDVESPSSQPMLLDQVWSAVEERLRAARAEAVARADADRQAAELEQSRVWNSVDDGRNVMDVPLPFATPPGAALTF